MSVIKKSYQSKSSHLTSVLSVLLVSALLLSGCGGDHHEVKAVDKVEEAAKRARASAPEAEVLDIKAEVTDTGAAVEPVVEDAVTEESAVEETAVVETEETTDAPAKEAPAAEADKVEEVVAEAQSSDTALTADAGKKLYESNCKACHETGLLNSPKFGDKEAWAPRIEKGREVLASHSAKGFNQMPAQAVNGVTEAQVQAAVDYMIQHSS